MSEVKELFILFKSFPPNVQELVYDILGVVMEGKEMPARQPEHEVMLYNPKLARAPVFDGPSPDVRKYGMKLKKELDRVPETASEKAVRMNKVRWSKPGAKARASKASKKALKKLKPRHNSDNTSIIGKVWEAMRQSSGELRARELAEILSLTQNQVSASLGTLLDHHPTTLKRRWVKGRMGGDDGATLVPGYYLYQYKGVTK